MKLLSQKDTCTPMFIYIEREREREREREKENMQIQPQKSRKYAICNNMDGILWRYYAKWNKSDRKTNTVWSHLYVESKKSHFNNNG